VIPCPDLLSLQAMMGFVFAIAGELATNHGVISQVAGRYDNQELVEKAITGSDLGFGAVVRHCCSLY